MIGNLFRKEAIEGHNDRLYGDILLLPRLRYKLIVILLFFWVALVSYWLFTSTYVSRVVVQGWLEPDIGVTRVYATGSGTIKEIMVSEGELVEAGRPLVVISNDRSLTSGELLGKSLIEEYEVQTQLIKNQIKLSQDIYQKQLEELIKSEGAGFESLKQIDQQIEISDKRLVIVKRQLERHRELSNSGHISLVILDSSTEQLLKLESERQALVTNRIYQLDRVKKLQKERMLLPKRHKNDLNHLRTRLSDIVQKIIQAKGQEEHVIRAPRKGVVDNLQARKGQYIHSNVPLLTLAPNNTRLIARVLVPVESAGFIAKGQALDIRYNAFPYQKFGAYGGVIEDISSNVLLPNEILSAPISANNAVYSLTVTLDAQSIYAYGQDVLLKSGMTFSADINVDERTLFEWLLEPIYNLKGRIF